MSLQVIGAGFGRTGTMSLKLALEQLGLGPCHHMIEVFGKPDHVALWQRAADGLEVDWAEVFEGYNAAVDWPVCAFWRELSEIYPDAKFILSRRDANKWYDSASATIFESMRQGLGDEEVHSGTSAHSKMVDTLIVNNTFSGNVDDREAAIAVYDAHNKEVMASLPPERLLVFEASQGWQPLCNFLGVPVPDTPYPRTNSTEEFRRHLKQ